MVGVDAVGPGAGDSARIGIGGQDARQRAGPLERKCDGTLSRAQIDGGPRGGQPGGSAPGQLRALPPRYVDTRVDSNVEAVEGSVPDDPGEGFAGQSTGHQIIEGG